MGMFLEFKKKSGKRDSDPRPQPWQGCALPTELFPRCTFKLKGGYFLVRGPVGLASSRVPRFW